MSTKPLVSILIPAYKPRHFQEALESALAQSYPNVEILIGDDSEDDAISGIVMNVSLKHANLRYQRNPWPSTGNGRRNHLTLLDQAQGEFVKFLNDDDVLEPDCVERLIAAFQAYPKATLAVTRRHLIDEQGHDVPEQHFSRPPAAGDLVIEGKSLAKALLETFVNFVGEPSTALFRKADVVGLEPDLFSFGGKQVRGIGDISLWTSLALKGDVIYLGEPLSRFRMHENQRQKDPDIKALATASITHMRKTWMQRYATVSSCLAGHILTKPFPVEQGAAWRDTDISFYGLSYRFDQQPAATSRQHPPDKAQQADLSRPSQAGSQDYSDTMSNETASCTIERDTPRQTADRAEYESALALLTSGNKIGAFAILQRLAESDSGLWEVYNDLAAIAVQEGEVDMAADLLEVAIAKAATPGKARFNLASIYASRNEGEKALEVLSPLLRHSPHDVEALALVREILGTHGKPISITAWARLVADLRMPTLCAKPAEAAAEKPQAPATWETIHALDDKEWLKALIDSVETQEYRKFALPGFPSDEIQTGMVGSSNEGALREGFSFYRKVKELCAAHGIVQRADGRLLDFGTGWGRFARIYLKDFRPGNIVGADVDPGFVTMCRDYFPFGSFETVDPFPPTKFPDNHFDLIVAYSVFSHLAPDAATAWIKEFSRILAPGGVIAITTQGRTFLDFCTRLRESGPHDNLWHASLARSFVDTEACQAAYDRGEFLFAPTGGGDVRPSTFYGEALVPRGFVEKHWSEHLELIEFIDDRKVLPQALIIMRKPGSAAAEIQDGEKSGWTAEPFRLSDEGVSKAISPKDEMFNYARTQIGSDEGTRSYYLETGREAAQNLLRFVAEQGLDPKRLDLLEFAAGYGRVTRWLAPNFKSTTIADLEQSMVDFHRENLDVGGFVSGMAPDSLAVHDKTYDLIFVFSLFTHLPESTWQTWLTALARLLRPGGHLVFSCHSYELFAQLNPGQWADRAKWTKDFVFWQTNETNGRLDTKAYGCNIVTPAFVKRAVKSLGGFTYVQRFKMGEFDRYHDMYAIRRDNAPAAANGVVLESTGHCPTCDRPATFRAMNPWLRDHFICLNCHSLPRERALMTVIESRFPNWRNLTIHESSPAQRGASRRLASLCGHYIASQFFPDLPPGETRKGVRCENLEAMTFADESIDLHITQDVMEHVFDPAAAFREIARTLRPGGAHIFTVPIVNKTKPSFRRARLAPSGEVEHLAPAEYHGNPISDQGSLVVMHWGFDIVDAIRSACGLETEVVTLDDLSKGIRAEYIEVLVTRKPAR